MVRYAICLSLVRRPGKQRQCLGYCHGVKPPDIQLVMNEVERGVRKSSIRSHVSDLPPFVCAVHHVCDGLCYYGGLTLISTT